MINLQNGLPNDLEFALYQALKEIARRAPDATVVPLFVDYTNQRVIIGSIVASSTPNGKMEVNGDMKIVGGGNGVILPNRAATHYYRLLIENDGTISADQIS